MAADRAINMALRVQGIGDVERDFKRAGDAGETSFSRIERAANGAARQVSDYHARLKRVAQQARADVANLPEFHKGDALTAARGRNQFVLDRIDAEKSRIRAGLPDMTLPGAAKGAANAGLLARGLGAVGGAAGAAGLAVGLLTAGVGASVAAFNEHDRALDKFNATLAFSGNLSGATRRQIESMADRVVDATLQTQEATLAAAASLARVPGITATALEQALDASARFADAMGTDVAAAAEQTAAVLTALADNDIKALVKAMEGLNPVVAATILSLAEAGRTAEAQQAYFKALADAAGDGPNGAARSADRLGDSWNRLKQSVGENFAGPAASFVDALTDSLNFATDATGRLFRGLVALAAAPLTGLDPVRAAFRGRAAAQDPLPGGPSSATSTALGFFNSAQARLYDARADAILNPEKQKRTRRGGGRGGKSDAEREAERLAREAVAARKAADRVREANDDVVASYRQRADEAAARLGLEGGALESVERKQEIDAAVRRLQVDLIEKEVAARRAAAAAARKPFDEAAATTEATAALAAQTDELRRHAAALYDDEQAQKDFLAQQERAAALLEATRTPLELMKREVASLVDLLRAGTITADVFDRRMQQIAEDMVDAAERGRNAWQGFGADVAMSLRDIALNGGSAMDVLRQLVAITAGRLFDQNIGLPLADAIDGVTGNNRDKNIASARSALPQASDIAAGSVANLGTNADLAASALGRLAIGDPLAPLTGEADASAAALRGVTAGAGQFGTTLASIIASLSGGGGGGGLLGLALNLGASALSGGSAAGISNGGAAVKALGKTPGFAGGGFPPIGMPFDVGENGKERMMLLPGGGARVFSGDQTRRMAANDGVSATFVQNINIPERADPRRTGTTLARATQGAIHRAGVKGLAAGPRRNGR